MAQETSNRSSQASGLNQYRLRWDPVLVPIILIAILLSFLVLSLGYRQYISLTSFSPLSVIGIGIALCLLTILFERLISITHVSLRARYRLSVLGSVFMGLGFLILATRLVGSSRALTSELVTGLFMIIWMVFSVSLGGLILTVQRDGLVENNFPPSEDVARQVYLQHTRWISDLNKTPAGKRSFDIFISLVGLFLSSPIWLLSSFLIWLEDPGPLLFVKNSVGKGGINFRQYKFRTMIRGAEEGTGPILAAEGDQRVLRTGKLLRKTALDELPQLVNILKGEMSFVGPRPQRTIMVEEYLKVMPEYADRHRVLPGLAGLAQVVGHYYLTPRQKLRFDRIYIQHANLRFDLLLILLAFLITFGYRWQKDWNGRLPRKLLHGKSRP
jgi:lipopolysaccharide/colanic/teichoic acid biosynthesis glycosyltransferase